MVPWPVASSTPPGAPALGELTRVGAVFPKQYVAFKFGFNPPGFIVLTVTKCSSLVATHDADPAANDCLLYLVVSLTPDEKTKFEDVAPGIFSQAPAPTLFCHWYVINAPAAPPAIDKFVGTSPTHKTSLSFVTVPPKPVIGAVTKISTTFESAVHSLEFSELTTVLLKYEVWVKDPGWYEALFVDEISSQFKVSVEVYHL